MFFTYIYRELRRRHRQALLTRSAWRSASAWWSP